MVLAVLLAALAQDADLRKFEELSALAGHNSAVTAVQWCPDSRGLISSSGESIRLWDPLASTESRAIGKHVAVWCVALSADGKTVFSGAADGVIRVWDLASGAEVRQLAGHANGVSALALSADGKGRVLAGAYNRIRLWDPATGKETGFMRTDSRAIVFSRDGKVLVSASEGGVSLWDAATGNMMKAIQLTPQRSVALSPDGKLFALGGDNGVVRIFGVRGTAAVAVALLPAMKEGRPAGSSPAAPVDGFDYKTGMAAAFSPDGRLLACVRREEGLKPDEGAKITVFDVQTGREECVVQGHKERRIESLVFARDRMLVAADRKEIRVWNVAGVPGLLRTFTGHSEMYPCVAASPDARTFAFAAEPAGGKYGIRLHESEVPVPRTLPGHGNHARAIAFRDDGKLLASAGLDRCVKIWEVASGRELRSLGDHPGGATTISWGADGRTLAVGCGDGRIKIWDADSSKELRSIQAHRSEPWLAALSPDGKTVTSGSSDGSLIVWDAATGASLCSIPGGRVRAVSWDGRLAAATSMDEKRMLVWSVGRTLSESRSVRTLTGHSDAVKSVAISPDGRTIASTGGDGVIRVWLKDGVKELRGKDAPSNPWKWIAFAPDGRHLAGLQYGVATVVLWEAATWAEKLVLHHRELVSAAAYSGDGKLLATVSRAEGLQIWDTAVYRVLRGSGPTTLESAAALCVSPDGATVAAAEGGGTVSLWDVATAKKRLSFATQHPQLRCVAFSGDGRLIATGGHPEEVRLWSAETGKMHAVLAGHTSLVTSMAIAPDGRVISASEDRSIRFWDVATLKSVRALHGHDGAVECVAVSRDGTQVVSAGADKTVRIWTAGP